MNARRATAALCLGLLLALAAGLHRWTHGFEVWTFDARRQQQLQAGELRAAVVALRGPDGREPRMWGAGGAAPAAYLVDFIYTRCPGVCRALGSEYQQMQRALAARPDAALPGAVHLVSISFDLEHDDPAQLARHAAQMGADPRYWSLAVPATHDGAGALLRSLGVVVVPDGAGGFVHNGAIHLLDGHGRLRGLYAFDQWPQALEAAQRLAAARREAAR
ncbi:MAG: SCO family protein [Pseudomonadota bacterium]